MFTIKELEELRRLAKKAHKEIQKGEGSPQGDWMISLSNSYIRMLSTLALNVRNRQVEDSILVLAGVKDLDDLDDDAAEVEIRPS